MMRRQFPRSISATLSILLAICAPVQASPVSFADAVQMTVAGRNGRMDMSLRLHSLFQGPAPLATRGAAESSDRAQAQGAAGVAAPDGVAPKVVSTITSPLQGGSVGVETIDIGDVTGTICDCGEIFVADKPGGFPKWPLLGLAVIPFLFINGGDDSENPFAPPAVRPIVPPPATEPPGQTPNSPINPPAPQPVPEPAAILLFGSSLLALGAGGRRRRRKNELSNAAVVKMEEQS